jgi:hypothetical protein
MPSQHILAMATHVRVAIDRLGHERKSYDLPLALFGVNGLLPIKHAPNDFGEITSGDFEFRSNGVQVVMKDTENGTSVRVFLPQGFDKYDEIFVSLE